MSIEDRMGASAARLVAHFGSASQITVTDPGVSAFGNDLSVTFTPVTFTTDCTVPTGYQGFGSRSEQIPTGEALVILDRSDGRITFEPQVGMYVDWNSEQYRISKTMYLPGSIWLYLSGGEPEGTGSA